MLQKKEVQQLNRPMKSKYWNSIQGDRIKRPRTWVKASLKIDYIGLVRPKLISTHPRIHVEIPGNAIKITFQHHLSVAYNKQLVIFTCNQCNYQTAHYIVFTNHMIRHKAAHNYFNCDKVCKLKLVIKQFEELAVHKRIEYNMFMKRRDTY